MTNKQLGDLPQAVGLRARVARIHEESPGAAKALEDMARKLEESAAGSMPSWIRDAVQGAYS